MIRQQPRSDAGDDTLRPFAEPGSAMPALGVFVVDKDGPRRAETVQQVRAAGYAAEAFGSVAALLARVEDLQAGCVLSGVSVAAADGKVLMEAAATRVCPLPVVALAAAGDVRAAVQAMKAGAADVLTLPLDAAELHEALQMVARLTLHGRDAADQPDVARRRVARLTRRERQVLEGMVRGEGNKGIAHALGISVRTVEVHRAKVMEKMACRSLPEIVRVALLAGLRGA